MREAYLDRDEMNYHEDNHHYNFMIENMLAAYYNDFFYYNFYNMYDRDRELDKSLESYLLSRNAGGVSETPAGDSIY